MNGLQTCSFIGIHRNTKFAQAERQWYAKATTSDALGLLFMMPKCQSLGA